jgi:hypothetical protein
VRGIYLLSAVPALAGVVVMLRAENPRPAASTPQRIETLVKQLGDPRFATREKAQRELESIGPGALEALRTAAKSEDQELRHRANEAVQRIDAAELAARMLAPKRVRLDCKETPVRAALGELQRQSGYAIAVSPGSRTALANRRVTVATGAVSFWEAFDALCQSGQLGEEAPTRGTATVPITLQVSSKTRPGGIEGDSAALPTYYAGAVRIRVLPAPEGRERTWPADETLVFLEVSPEPGLKRFTLDTSLSLRQASDNQGQTLSLHSHEVQGDNGVLGEVGRNHVMVLHLKLGKKHAGRIKLLEGMLNAKAMTPLEPVLELPDILKAAGKSMKGKRGGSLEVLAIDRQANGAYQLQVRMTNLANENPLANIMPIGGPMRAQQVVVQGQQVMIQFGGPGGRMRRRIVSGYDAPLPVLVDAKGEALPQSQAVQRQIQATSEGLVEDATLLFRPRAGQGEPARLILNGQRMANLPIAFRLSDVPLQ